MQLSKDEFARLIRIAPLVSIDLICRDEGGNILLLKRKDRPAKDCYFVPGGRIRKDEEREEAFLRILKTETGLSRNFAAANFLGAYDHFYADNKSGDPSYGTHYVALGYEIQVSSSERIVVDDHHSHYTWMSEKDARVCEDVDKHAKAYLDVLLPGPNNEEFLVGSGILYESLMHHYTHYDAQLWSRTQLVIAVQGVALIASYEFNDKSTVIVSIFIASAILTLAIWYLIKLDYHNSRVNQHIMDFISERVFAQHRLKRPRLRAERSGRVRGYRLVLTVVITLAVIDIGLACVYGAPPGLTGLISDWFSHLR